MLLDLFLSPQQIRYDDKVGDFRTLYTSASGKAFLSTLPLDKRVQVVSKLKLLPETPNSRGGQHMRDFLKLSGITAKPGWQGKLVTDDFSGYKACFDLGVIEVGCMVHARRKFQERWVNHGSQVGEQALKLFGELYDIEREVAEADSVSRLELRRRQSQPAAEALHHWMRHQRQKIPDGSATAKAIDYSPKRWQALTRFLEDGDLPIDKNWVENRIRLIAITGS